jgi:hypothetical protein
LQPLLSCPIKPAQNILDEMRIHYIVIVKVCKGKEAKAKWHSFSKILFSMTLYK